MSVFSRCNRRERARPAFEESFGDADARISEISSRAIERRDLELPSELFDLKRKRDDARDELEFWESGLAQTRAKLAAGEHDLKLLQDRAVDAQGPLLIAYSDELAADVIRLESEAVAARGKLQIFSMTHHRTKAPALSPRARAVLQGPLGNARDIAGDTSLAERCAAWKRQFVGWRMSMESDANAEVYEGYRL